MDNVRIGRIQLTVLDDGTWRFPARCFFANVLEPVWRARLDTDAQGKIPVGHNHGLVQAGAIADGAERATFIAYLFTVLVVLPVTIYIAIKEKTQWAMAVVLGGALVVAILIARVQQIWSLNA